MNNRERRLAGAVGSSIALALTAFPGSSRAQDFSVAPSVMEYPVCISDERGSTANPSQGGEANSNRLLRNADAALVGILNAPDSAAQDELVNAFSESFLTSCTSADVDTALAELSASPLLGFDESYRESYRQTLADMLTNLKQTLLEVENRQ